MQCNNNILIKYKKKTNFLSKFYGLRINNYFFFTFFNYNLFKYFLKKNYFLINNKIVAKLISEENQSLSILIY